MSTVMSHAVDMAQEIIALNERNRELLAALDTLSSVVGLTAIKYEGQRMALQEAFDLARTVLAKAQP